MVKRVPPGPVFAAIDVMLGQIIKSRSLTPMQFLSFFPPFGDISYWGFGGRKLYFLNHPDLIREVLVEKAASYRKNQLTQKGLRPFLGEGLLLSEGELHREQRKLMQPAFHSRRIESYAQFMVEHTGRVLADWRVGEERDLAAELMKLTLTIVGRTLLGVDISGDAPRIGELVTTMLHFADQTSRRLVQLPDWVPTPHQRQVRRTVAELHGLMGKIIAERRRSGTDHGDLLSMLLLTRDESGAGMTDAQVCDEALTMILAGHETTANTLAWALSLLGRHPEIAQALEDEVGRVLGGRAAGLAELPQLQLTDQVIKESLRLYPPAPVFTREPIGATTLGGYEIPEGAILVTAPYFLHRDPRYFVEPLRFWPERWAGGLERSLPRCTYFPFGAGPRICIGQQFALMEARLLLASLVSKFRFTLAPGQGVEEEAAVTLRPKNGLRMRLGAVRSAGRPAA